MIDIAPDRTSFAGIPNENNAWKAITEKALESKNLRADIRVDRSGASTVVKDRSTLWRFIKPWFGYSTSSKEIKDDTVTHLKTHLTNYVSDKASREKVVVDEVKFKGVLNDLENNADSFSTSKAIQLAHNETLKLFEKASAGKKGVDRTTQVVFFDKTEGEDKVPSIAIIEPAPDYEEVSFSGGGNKGSGYGGAYRVLDESGKLKKLQRVSGSSVGTIPAAFTAVGMSADQFDQSSEEIEALDFMKESKNVNFKKKLREHITFDKSKLGYEGTLALEKINKQLTDSVLDYFLNIKPTEKDWKNLEGKESQAMVALRESLVQGTSPLFTFKHLALLRKMNPEKFKDLSICVYNESEDKPVFFNSAVYNDSAIEDSKKEKILNLPIVAAIRMSAAFPVAFKPVKWQGKVMKDGGIIANNPSTEFQRGHYQQKVGGNDAPLTPAALVKASTGNEDHSKILYLTFDYGGETYDVLHRGKIEVARSLAMSLRERISKNFRFRRDKTEENADQWSRGLNVKVVYHGLLETLSFLASKKQREAAKLQAEIRMREQLAAHQHEATYRTYSLTEWLNILSNSPEKITDAALEAIIQEGTKEQKDFINLKNFQHDDLVKQAFLKRALAELTSLLEAAAKEKAKRDQY